MTFNQTPYFLHSPNQAVLDHLPQEQQIRAWNHWIESNTPSEHLEVSSTLGGYNQFFNRIKVAGNFQTLLEAFEDLESKSDFYQETLDSSSRIAARITLPRSTHSLLSQLETSKISQFIQSRGYELEYCYPDFGENGEPVWNIFFGKNNSERNPVSEIFSDEDFLRNAQSKRQHFESSLQTNPPQDLEIIDTNQNQLSKMQILQLTYHWKNCFNPGYTAKVVTEMLDQNQVLIVVATDAESNVVGACTGEPDGMGGVEISEFFSRQTYNQNRSSRYILSHMVRLCQEKFPGRTLYMEANCSSTMGLVAARCGFVPIQNPDGTLAKTRANVKVGGLYRNFYLMKYLPRETEE